MVWFLIGFILTLIYIVKEHKWFSLIDYPIMFLIGMFITTLTWTVVSLFVTLAVVDNGLAWEVSTDGVEWKTVTECELEMINDREYIDTVTLDEEMYYRISVKKDGVVTTELCDVENTIVQEGNEAVVEAQTSKFESDILSAIFIPMIDDRYVITIPSE